MSATTTTTTQVTESKNKSWLVSRDFKNFHLSEPLQNELSKVLNIDVTGQNGHYEVVLNVLIGFLKSNEVSENIINDILAYYDNKLNVVEKKQEVPQPTQPNMVAIESLEVSKESERTFKTWLSSGNTKEQVYQHIENNCKEFAIFNELEALKLKFGF